MSVWLQAEKDVRILRIGLPLCSGKLELNVSGKKVIVAGGWGEIMTLADHIYHYTPFV